MTATATWGSAAELAALLEPGQVYELRIPKAGRHRTVSGYFNNPYALAQAVKAWDGKAPGLYLTLNPVTPALLARAMNRAKPYAELTTSDTDIARRTRLFVDLDPVRPSGIASTDAEHQAALDRARAIREGLTEIGWPAPILMDSGNGGYLVYAIGLPNDAAATALVKGALEGLAYLYGDDVVKIDTGVANAARIARIPGTLNCKGDNTPERPHRRARIVEAPAQLVPVSAELLERLAASVPKQAEEEPRRNGTGHFDLDEFIVRHGIEVRSDLNPWKDGIRLLRLVRCIFNKEHVGGSAALLQFPSGGLAYKCQHNDCTGRGWREFRERLEPGCYRERDVPRPSTADAPETEARQEAPESRDARPDLAARLDEIENLVRRYVVLSQHAAVAVALWIVHTHVFDQFETSPYLAITSAEKRSGKTRLLDVLALFVARVWRAVMPSEAVVFRKIAQDAPTLLLDEVDAIYGPKAKEHEGLRALLNAGHRKGTKVPRCVGDGARQRIEEFSVYCPKALAGIGELPDTVRDRSIRIRLRRRAPDETVERFRRRTAEAQARPIMEFLEAWAAQGHGLGDARPTIPDELDDRAEEGWEILLAIADLAGGEWPRRAREAAIALHATGERSDASLGVRLLADLRQIFEDRHDPDELTTEALLAALHALEESPWAALGREGKPLAPHGLARLLRPYGVRPKVMRIGKTTPRGYARQALLDPWTRYVQEIRNNGSPSPSQKGSETQQRNNGGADTHGERVSGSESASESECCDVADQPPSGRKGEADVEEGEL